MRRSKAVVSPLLWLVALAVVALTLYGYRELATRLFAADDYQWLLNVRGISLGQAVSRAFDAGAQSHFYRPLVWLLFWAQTRAFGLDMYGFHAVSLGLHLLNAGLLGWLFYRLAEEQGPRARDQARASSSFVFGLLSVALVVMIVALHPAPFEAIVWVSAQSELLAAALLLAALHFWLIPTMDDRRLAADDRQYSSIVDRRSSFLGRWRALLATIALGLALLAKESAVIGLPLLMLIGSGRAPTRDARQRFRAYILPTIITLAYIALQLSIERRNYLLRQGGYGFGWQLVLNPLRSLALIVAPLPGSEHADASWLVPVGAALALLLVMLFGRGRWGARRLVLALGLTLLPTAPFSSPPDSRYLYLPVMAAALMIGVGLVYLQRYAAQTAPPTQIDIGQTSGERSPLVHRPSSAVVGRGVLFCSLFCILALAWAAASELHAREGRFAAASGPGGSLWRLASAVCASSRPERMVIVDPPLAAPHAEAIIGLACGSDVRVRIVGRTQLESAIKGRSVVIGFPNGSAEVERRMF
jgi:hypothetical protein